MENTKPNDMAYPVHVDTLLNNRGLTKREYFAAMAMQGLCATPINGPMNPENEMILAVRYADALIAELNKPTE